MRLGKDKDSKNFDHRLKVARWRGRLSEFRWRHYRAIILVVAFIAIAIAFLLWLPKGPRHFVRYDYGVVESGFVPGSKRVAAMQLSIRLESGLHVVTSLPADQPYLKGARVKIGMYAFDSDDRGVIECRFVAYLDQNLAPPP